jgi:hypothetical protein
LIDLSLFFLYYKGPVTADIPTTRRVYETVLNGLGKIGANYPIGKYFESEIQLKMIFL